VIRQIPRLHLGAQLRELRRCGRRPEHELRELGERLRVREHAPDRRVEIREKALKVDDARTAVDPIRLAVHVDLTRMTRGARHADVLAAAATTDREADGKSRGTAVLVGQIPIAPEARRHERLSARLLQCTDPIERHDARALIAAVEIPARRSGPLLALIDEDRRCRDRERGQREEG
jgi:hypothetical protein